jgi:hypothetical protein
MPNVISQIATQLPQPTLPPAVHAAGELLRGVVEGNAYVGEVVSLGYNDAILQIHDFHRQQVGGIPALCFLVASRVNPQTTPVRGEFPSGVAAAVLALEDDAAQPV